MIWMILFDQVFVDNSIKKNLLLCINGPQTILDQILYLLSINLGNSKSKFQIITEKV